LENPIKLVRTKVCLKLTVLKSIITKLRRFKLQKPLENILLIVFPLLIFDVLVAVLGSFYLSDNAGAFLGKSIKINLSNLLFVEGSVIFAAGTFTLVARVWRRTRPSILMVIVGVILIVLSIMVATLLP